MAETRILSGSEEQPEKGQIINNAGVRGSSPRVATSKFKGLTHARPFFMPIDHSQISQVP